MDVEPGGTWSAPTQLLGDEETASPAVEPAPTLNGNGSHAEVDRTVEREDSPAELVARLMARERAVVQAQERAARAEEDAAALRVTLAVVTSVAEVTIEASAQLVDEARRFAQALAEAHESTAEVPKADAQRVISEARAAVAQLRADLLEDLADDDAEGAPDAVAVGGGDSHPLPGATEPEQGSNETPVPAVPAESVAPAVPAESVAPAVPVVLDGGADEASEPDSVSPPSAERAV